MTKDDIKKVLVKAIREGKYLKITYLNQYNENSSYWICILDVLSNGDLKVNMFNVTKDDPAVNAKIFLEKIQTAEILPFTIYDVPEGLINKLNEDDKLLGCSVDQFDNNILNYYLECYKSNIDPFLYKNHLISGIDVSELANKHPFQLSDEQLKQFVKDIYHNDYKKYYSYELAICELSIDLRVKDKFVVAYRKLKFDPVSKTIHVDKNTHFNPNFYIRTVKHSLSYYTDMSPSEFESIYLKNITEAIEVLESNFSYGELINTRPEIVVLGYSQIDISAIYDNIHTDHSNREMEVPLKAFFQNLSSLDRKNRAEPHIVLYDQNINIDQIQTIYNALKYPITYVQGPPGTGKTQTILNIVVNALTNNKTLLITSNNNVPIDGIKEKLNLGTYRNNEIRLPILRLGNNEFVKKAIKFIKELYEFETKEIVKEQLLFNLKEKSKENNKRLLEKIKNYERRLELTENQRFVEDVLKNGSNYLLEREMTGIEESLAKIPETKNDDLDNLYEVIKDNYQMLQYFFYDSLKYIKRLKTKDYSKLIEIVYLDDEDQQVKEFNKWLASDENLEKLTRVFPVILTTNISSRKLGHKYKFDLLVIDEAGQCDVATSLIPVSKCKNMVLIGDTNQLKPIIIFDEKSNQKLMKYYGVDKVYDYYRNSILSVFREIDNISRNILLSYHYRCGKAIINFSNMRFYENRLNLAKIRQAGNVKLIEVNNLNQKNRNGNIEEAQHIVDYIQENQMKDVFIITPFRNQQQVLDHFLNEAKKNGIIDSSVTCGTIHKIQGQENKTIIISTSISRNTSSKTYDWIKNNSQLINVGVTRAQENLVVVADSRAIDILSRKDDDLYALIDYVKKNGNTEVPLSKVNRFTIGYSNDSEFENEFYRTMSHYCSVDKARFDRNVKIVRIFPEVKEDKTLNKKEFDGVIYENNIPRVVFEINGDEHRFNKKVINSDQVKINFLQSKNVALLSIPNHYVKHYEFIRELMCKIKGLSYQKELFDVND
jgi:superfamily I DNA and/or RNA helicase